MNLFVFAGSAPQGHVAAWLAAAAPSLHMQKTSSHAFQCALAPEDPR